MSGMMGKGNAVSWAVLIGLGAFHGVNPGMGWLFAVALGLQERSRRAVFRALLPLAVGHALAVGAAVAVSLAAGVIMPLKYVRWMVAVVLLSLGTIKLSRHKHPRWASMRVSIGALTLWSFLMASAHGAGFMVVPVFMHMTMAPPSSHSLHGAAAASTGAGTALLATALHAFGYLVVTALAAIVVFEKFGLGLLRTSWFNLDLMWAGALIVTGILTLWSGT
jgi:hypothetical protein